MQGHYKYIGILTQSLNCQFSPDIYLRQTDSTFDIILLCWLYERWCLTFSGNRVVKFISLSGVAYENRLRDHNHPPTDTSSAVVN